MNRSAFRRGLILGILLVLIAIALGGAQKSTDSLFSPLDQVYKYIKTYFYWPERIDNQKLLYGALKGMVQQLDDPYSEFMDPQDYEQFEESMEGKFSGVGIEITIKDGVLTVIAPLADTPAEKAGVRAGDQILEIDGESTEGITLSEASVKIRGPEGTTVTLHVRHKDGTEEDIPIVRATITVDSVSSKTVADGKVAYIRVIRFDQNVALELDKALLGFDLDHMDGIILDLRNNPGGLLRSAISVSSRFVDKGIILTVKDRVSGDESYWSTGNTIPNLPLAVLVNGGTASAAEITAGAIRDHEMGILIGEKTFGKGVIQRMINFPDGSALKITTGEYHTPSGRAVQGVGIEPDITLAEDEDPIEVATAWIEAHAGERMPIALGNQ